MKATIVACDFRVVEINRIREQKMFSIRTGRNADDGSQVDRIPACTPATVQLPLKETVLYCLFFISAPQGLVGRSERN
jgi:hypothetical protein